MLISRSSTGRARRDAAPLSGGRRWRRVVLAVGVAALSLLASAAVSEGAQAPGGASDAELFQVGDVVVLDVAGVPTLSDTFQVRDGMLLQLPNLPSLSLSGVRRADVQSHLAKELARYLVNPEVRAFALVRIGVMGAVETPGFYVVRADTPVNDVLMYAGGLTSEANPDRISIRRSGKTVIEEKPLRGAFATGATIETLRLRTGDQVMVKERRRVDWVDVLRNGAYLAGIIVSLYAARRAVS